MIIAQKKKKENIAAYLLYMWHVEDVIRASHFDMPTIHRTLISSYNRPEKEKAEISRWYEDLIRRMRAEGVEEKGHLRAHAELLASLTGLHLRLLDTPGETLYRAAYQRILPYIVQLRARSGGREMPEIETCFTAVYGYITLKMQRKNVSGETHEAIRQVSAFLSFLAGKYRDEQYGKDE
jgi:hypothetical protein